MACLLTIYDINELEIIYPSPINQTRGIFMYTYIRFVVCAVHGVHVCFSLNNFPVHYALN